MDRVSLIKYLLNTLPNVNRRKLVEASSFLTKEQYSLNMQRLLSDYFKSRQSNLLGQYGQTTAMDAVFLSELFPNVAYKYIWDQLNMFIDLPNRAEIVLRILLNQNGVKTINDFNIGSKHKRSDVQAGFSSNENDAPPIKIIKKEDKNLAIRKSNEMDNANFETPEEDLLDLNRIHDVNWDDMIILSDAFKDDTINLEIGPNPLTDTQVKATEVKKGVKTETDNVTTLNVAPYDCGSNKEVSKSTNVHDKQYVRISSPEPVLQTATSSAETVNFSQGTDSQITGPEDEFSSSSSTILYTSQPFELDDLPHPTNGTIALNIDTNVVRDFNLIEYLHEVTNVPRDVIATRCKENNISVSARPPGVIYEFMIDVLLSNEIPSSVDQNQPECARENLGQGSSSLKNPIPSSTEGKIQNSTCCLTLIPDSAIKAEPVLLEEKKILKKQLTRSQRYLNKHANSRLGTSSVYNPEVRSVKLPPSYRIDLNQYNVQSKSNIDNNNVLRTHGIACPQNKVTNLEVEIDHLPQLAYKISNQNGIKRDISKSIDMRLSAPTTTTLEAPTTTMAAPTTTILLAPTSSTSAACMTTSSAATTPATAITAAMSSLVGQENKAPNEVRDLILDTRLVNRLCEIFPDACPIFIREICNGKVMGDEVVNDLITDILERNSNYPKRPPPTPDDDVDVGVEQQFEILKDVLPDADPDYLRMMCDRYEGKPDLLKTFLNQAVERKDYPTLKEFQRRQQLSAQQKQYTSEFSVENFVKLIPDPKTFFSDKSRTVKKDHLSNHYALTVLRNIFDKVPVRIVQSSFIKSNGNFLNTFLTLQHAEVMKTRRKAINLPATIDNIPLLQEIAYCVHNKAINDYLKKMKEVEDVERNEAKQHGLLQTCGCCYDEEVLPKDAFSCNNECTFCKSCIIKSTEVKFGEGKLDFPCLMDCSGHFTLQTLQAALSPKFFSKLAQKKALAEVKAAGIEELEMCPFCDFATIPPEGDKIFSCLNPECMKQSCRFCKEPSHIPLRCDEIEKDDDVKARVFVENKMTEALLRKCYKCGVKFFKEEGCNKMTCSCGALMCYVCGMPVANYTHFNGEGGDNYNLCPLYSDTNKLNKENVLKGANEAKAEIGEKELKIDPTKDIDHHFRNRPSTSQGFVRAHHINYLNPFGQRYFEGRRY